MNNTKESCPHNFIKKLIEMLEDDENAHIVQFDHINKELEILSKKKLEKILPKYYRHGNFDSFSRQLNWYGFVKLRGQRGHIYLHDELKKGCSLQDLKSKRTLTKNPEDKSKPKNLSKSLPPQKNDIPDKQPQLEYQVKEEPVKCEEISKPKEEEKPVAPPVYPWFCYPPPMFGLPPFFDPRLK